MKEAVISKPMPKGGGWIIVIFLMILFLPPIYAYGSWVSGTSLD